MKYFIAYRLRGREAEQVDELRREIADRFGVRAALRMPPHITLFPPFEADDVAALERALSRIALVRKPFVAATPRFASFPERVWFIEPEQHPEFFALKEAVVGAVEETVSAKDPRGAVTGTHFHLTLAYRDVSPEAFSGIGKLLEGRGVPISHLRIDAVTLLERDGDGWRTRSEYRFGGV